jgi:hypothetical protein
LATSQGSLDAFDRAFGQTVGSALGVGVGVAVGAVALASVASIASAVDDPQATKAKKSTQRMRTLEHVSRRGFAA